ncbi:MAG: U32 family peptidase [Oscillospiraceae bacterium]|nr:U32 family peptidase [Oscillospiraceae bacterium]
MSTAHGCPPERGGKAEILAPAGGMPQLVAAVRSGAGAVYLGNHSLNARRGAENFSEQELSEASCICKEAGVKIYLALNTLVLPNEYGAALSSAELACKLSLDGIIVQDLGLAALIRRCAPEMPLHASTQMTAHSPSALKLLSELGFSRAVLARELSREEIAEIVTSSPIETEVFVHGALCMSVSGQCYFSSVLGGRSGNRGMCAQPCRLPFTCGGAQNVLSLRDMSYISHIRELCEVGVTSLKIEGRLKRPEYVAAAVTACRLARDSGNVPDTLRADLESVFSRSGFTDGYYTARRGAKMFGVRTKSDSENSSAAVKRLHELYKNQLPVVPVSMVFRAFSGEEISLSASDCEENTASVIGQQAEKAINKPLSHDYALSCLSKTGGTVYRLSELKLNSDGICAVSGKELNSLRREALDALSLKRKERTPIPFCSTAEYSGNAAHSASPPLEEEKRRQLVFADSRQLPDCLEDYSGAIYSVSLPVETDSEVLAAVGRRLSAADIKLFTEAPRAFFGQEERLLLLMKKAADAGITDITVHNIGQIALAQKAGLSPHGGFGLNVISRHALAAAEDMGLHSCEMSFEMTLAQMREINSPSSEMTIPSAVIVYGHLPLMLTRNCPAAQNGHCGRSNPSRGGENPAFDRGLCEITDRLGNKLPVRCAFGCSEVFNPIPVSIVDKTDKIRNINRFVARFYVENYVETGKILSDMICGKTDSFKGATRGLYFKGVQ